MSVNITKKEAELSILNIKYNGVETAIPQNAFVAKWSYKSGSITHLEQAVFVQGQVSILATYNGKATKITTYKSNDPNKKTMIDDKLGMIRIQLVSDKGYFNIKY